MTDSYTKSLEFFDRYFNGNILEFPNPSRDNLLANEFGEGILWEYISHDFLNGFINYVKILGAFGINRYRHPSEKDINNIYLSTHPNLAAYQDDIIILALSKECGRYFYFYYDRDVSDCMIGTFMTNDEPCNIWENFLVHVHTKNYSFCESYLNVSKEEVDRNKDYHPIQLKKLSGWIKG